MSTPTREPTRDRIFDSLIERQASLYDIIRAGNERIHRFNRSLIEGARQGSRDWTEVGRRWANSPTDMVGVWEAVSDAIGNSQARTLALAREWVEDAVTAQRETRDAFQQGFGDVREVVQRVQENGNELMRRARSAPARTRRNGEKATAES
jgi:hypothetical protein